MQKISRLIYLLPSLLLTSIGFKGPVGLMIGTFFDDVLKQAANLIAFYRKSNSSPVTVKSNNGKDTTHVVEKQCIDVDNLKI